MKRVGAFIFMGLLLSSCSSEFRYRFCPKPDITPFELALILQSMLDGVPIIKAHPELDLKRHACP